MRSRFSNPFFYMVVLGVVLLGVMSVVGVGASPAVMPIRQLQRRAEESFRNAFPTENKNPEPEMLASEL